MSYADTEARMYLITWITNNLPTPEGWMAELAMLAETDSGRLNHKVVTHPASSHKTMKYDL